MPGLIVLHAGSRRWSGWLPADPLRLRPALARRESSLVVGTATPRTGDAFI